MSLQPTIWRTCRTLANNRRLSCLRAVLLRSGESVGELAESLKLPQDQASLCLRALQARGLLQARRDGRWVRYFPWPDLLVPTAAPILVAMTHALIEEKLSGKRVIHCLTAFTHPRRLTLLRCLQQGGVLSFTALKQRSHISSPALVRHLRKLHARGLVQGNANGWSLTAEQNPLSDSFLRLIALTCEQ